MLPTCNSHHDCAATVARAENEMLDALKRGPALYTLEALIMNRGRVGRLLSTNWLDFKHNKYIGAYIIT